MHGWKSALSHWRTKPSMQAAQWNLWTFWHWGGSSDPQPSPLATGLCHTIDVIQDVTEKYWMSHPVFVSHVWLSSNGLIHCESYNLQAGAKSPYWRGRNVHSRGWNVQWVGETSRWRNVLGVKRPVKERNVQGAKRPVKERNVQGAKRP